MSMNRRTWITLLVCVAAALSFACAESQEPAANTAPKTANAAQTPPPPAASPAPAPESANVSVTPQSANSSPPAKPGPVTIRAKDMKAAAGATITLEIEVTSADDLGAMMFTLDFDPAVFKYVSSVIGPKAPKEGVLQVNDKQTSAGKLGVLIYSGTGLPKGKSTIMTADFEVLPDAAAGQHKFTFSSKPTIQSVSTFKAVLVDAAFVPATVRVTKSR